MKILRKLLNIMPNHGYPKYFEQKNYELWIKLISSDWFSIFLTYLDMEDIVRLELVNYTWSMNHTLPLCLASFCPDLEYLKLYAVPASL